MQSDRKQIHSCLGIEKGLEGRVIKGHKFLDMMDTFIILIVKIYQIKYFVNRLIKPQRVIKKKNRAGHMKGREQYVPGREESL